MLHPIFGVAPIGAGLVAETAPQLGGVLDTNAQAIDESEGTAVDSATTTDIWVTDGNTVHITGTTTITSFGTAPRVGAWRRVIFDAALTLTDGANLNLPGAANITTAADDFCFVYAETTTLFKVLYFREDGTPVVGSVTQATQAALEAETNENTYAPPDLLKHNPGVAKVWVKFDVAGTVNASHNVDSVTDTGTGDWTVNITTDFSGVNYSVVLGWRDDSAGFDRNDIMIGSQAAGSFQYLMGDSIEAGEAALDPAAADDMHAAAFGDQA